MIFLIRKTIRWPQGCLIFFAVFMLPMIFSCEHKEEYNSYVLTKQDSIDQQRIITRAFRKIYLDQKNIKTGDVVTRTGNDFTSQSLRKLNMRNQTYSHCGIASIEHDSIFIYHSVGGEWNPDEKLRRDPFELFAEPYSNKGFGIFRFTLADSSIGQLMTVVQQYYREGLMFDMDFDLKTDNRMYCAELIYKSFLKASGNKMTFNTSKIGDFVFIGVDDIFLHPLCKMKIETVYN